MAATYERIATTTLSSATVSYTFTSIPSTYTDIVMVSSILGVSSESYSPRIILNSDSANNYSVSYIYATGSASAGGRQSNATFMYIGQLVGYPTTGNPINIITHFQNYSNTTTLKTVLSRSNSANTDLDAIAGLWRSTSAINSINIQFQSGTNMQIGTTFTLYGIKAGS